MASVTNGTICRVNDRGFGFIERAGTSKGADVFFHASDLASDSGLVFGPELNGAAVAFSLVDSPKGPRAVGVRLI